MGRSFRLGFVVFLGAVLLFNPAHAVESKKKTTGKGTSNILYVCDCGNDCKCNFVSKKPEKCSCGKETIATHLLKIDETDAILCKCGKDCTCKPDPNDPTKCGCGKTAKKISIKGKYVCGCGPDCFCNSISDKPGKCSCGKPLVKVE